MADVLKRLAGPTQVAKTTIGTTIYTPGSGVTGSIRNAIAANPMAWDAWLDIAVNAIATPGNILLNGLYVPAFKTVAIPLDEIVSNAAGDIVVARQRPGYQDIIGSATRIATPAVVANGTGTAGSASSVATGSWTEVSGALYLLAVCWSASGGAGTISSFTETHAGITWTQLGSNITSADGKTKLALYSGVSTGTTAATTTVTFSGTQNQGALVAITNMGTVFDSSVANGAEAMCLLGSGEDARNTATPSIYIPSQAHSTRVYIAVQEGGNALSATAGSGATELNDITNSIASGLTMQTAQMLGTVQNNPAIILPVWSAATGIVTSLGAVVEMFEPVSPLRVTLNGVESS